jgi:dTDP-L-rhamnose 4-epimerase
MLVLVTGGAGFIGSHLVDGLLAAGHQVRVVDALAPQVHGADGGRPDYLDPEVELIVGDLLDSELIERSMEGVEAVLHQAAAVGVGQSMYEISAYVKANVLATARLLEAIVERRERIRKVLVASSMSNYGEGRYRTAAGDLRAPPPRSLTQLEARDWELRDPHTGEVLHPMPTDEEKPLQPTSVYATTKRDQEELTLNVCRAYGIPAVALRYFNVYGTRQALSNPYTGVAAIFCSRILNDQPPLIFEDGRQSRDFTHVTDIVQANLLALERDSADGRVLNIGTGQPTDLLQLSTLLLDALGKSNGLRPEIVARFREGDIRHCYADITAIQDALGYRPRVSISEGIPDLIEWASRQTVADRVGTAVSELEERSLIR